MAQRSNNFTPKFKFYHVILISIMLSPLLIINSNSLNKKREKEKQLKQDEIIMRKLYARNLEDDTFAEDTKTICKKGTEELQKYYETGDGNIIGIKDDDEVKSKKKDEYVDALINLISSEGDTVDNLKTYLMHIIPIIVFLVISILFLPGWIVCCFCCCCNCCCCCCCKKPGCKIPFYIITLVIYALGFVISIYGLSQSNSIFVGLADTECSILKFIGEVLDGETKADKPKWLGIANVKILFQNTKKEIAKLKNDLVTDLDGQKNAVTSAKNQFESEMQNRGDTIKNNIYYKENLENLSDSLKRGNYKLDLITTFGEFNAETKVCKKDSLMEFWYMEYEETAKNADELMDTIKTNYDNLCQNNEAESALDQGVESIETIEGSFNEIKNSISGIIINYSELIDSYGKLAFKIAFSVLMAMNAIIAAFISFQLFCSFSSSSNKCLNCLLKSLIHIFWNILALITFVVLFLGSIFSLIGTAGKDLVSVFEFVVSADNLGQENPVLLEGAPSYLTNCINGNGDIVEELNLNMDSIENIDELNKASTQIGEAKTKADDLLSGLYAYNQYKKQYEDIKGYKIDNFTLIKITSTNEADNAFIFKVILENIKTKKPNDEWSISCDNPHSCTAPRASGNSDKYCIKPETCDSSHKVIDWYNSDSDNDLKDNAKILDAFIHSVSEIKSQSDENGIYKALESLREKYVGFLTKETDTLTIYNDTISSLTKIFKDVLGNENTTISDILNCRFIGKNVKVLLKNLDKSLGKDFYTVGICLVVAGLAMCFSISFTILLNIIITKSKEEKPLLDHIPEMEMQNYNNNGVRVISYN